MQYPRTIRNFNAFLDGISYAGRCTEGMLPELTLATAAHRGAGQDAPMAVDMGMEAMQAELKFAEWNPAVIVTFGTRLRFVMRPAALGEDDFEADTIIATIGGRVAGGMFDRLNPSNESPLTMKMEADYFRMTHNGVELFEIDVENGRRVIGGTDQLAGIRQAMGI